MKSGRVVHSATLLAKSSSLRITSFFPVVCAKTAVLAAAARIPAATRSRAGRRQWDMTELLVYVILKRGQKTVEMAAGRSVQSAFPRGRVGLAGSVGWVGLPLTRPTKPARSR